MNTPSKLSKIVVYLLLTCQMTSSMAAATPIASVPVDTSNIVPPNIIFALDDSGSMDMEVMQDTEDGSFWFKRVSSSFAQFYDSTGKPNFDADYRYGYLFPVGATLDTRTISTGTEMYAVPPLPEYGFVRSSSYNSIYYNPAVTYFPWEPAYIGTASRSFTAASSTAPRSHPVLPLTGTATTVALTATSTNEANNFTFKMVGGMVIPANTRFRKDGGTWKSQSTALTIASGDRYDVAPAFYPATYWSKITTACPSGATCSTSTPDGARIQRFEIKSGTTFPSGRSYADELQNFANWFQYYRKRKLMLAASMGQVLSQLTSIRGGVSKFNDTSGSGGTRPNVTMYDFSSTTPASNWQATLGTIYTNPADGGTPTRDSLTHVGKQFMRTDASAPVLFACQRNAAMVLSDGFATASNAANVPSYSKSTYGAAAPYATTTTNTLADIALYYYTTNLRSTLTPGQVAFDPSDLSPNADRNRNIHMNTYALTLGVKGTIFGKNAPATNNPFTTTPAWPTSYTSNQPTAVDDLWHATINGRGLMLSAEDATTTTAKVQDAISDVLIKAGAQSAVAVSRVNLKAGDSTAYVSSYQVNGWYGDLQAYPIDPATGDINSASPQWSAQANLDVRAPGSRIIAIGEAGGAVPFRHANVSAATKTALNLTTTSDSADVIDWLRGVRTKETVVYRARSHVLGDLVHSEPEVVKGAAAAYLDNGYGDFASGVATRTRALYVGGNDGMLHAFDSTNGNELWAYIPSFVTPRLKNLASKSYTHQFYVDSSPVSGDIQVGTEWRTILVAGLRGGGAGFVAMNVTSPTVADETELAGKVMWEFPNASTPATAASNVGLSFGKPVIAKVAGHGWVVIVSSGYNNTGGDGKGHLFVLNAATGALIADVATAAGSAATPSGLAQISAYASNGRADAQIDTVYGGDLQGNVWRFNLTGAASTWNAVKLATLTDGTNVQSITSAPEVANVTTLAGTKRIIFVGTGRLLAQTDIVDTQKHSFYGLVDDLTDTPTIASVRTALQQKTMSTVGTGRTISGSAVDYTEKKGWYFDFGTSERVTTDPQAAFGSIIFSTNIPSQSACSSASMLYAISMSTGGEIPAPPGKTQLPAGQLLGTALASRPVIVITTTGKVKAITHLANNGVVVSEPPVSATTPPRAMAWKAITR
jgi:type IV pilus assembly protein PilY1